MNSTEIMINKSIEAVLLRYVTSVQFAEAKNKYESWCSSLPFEVSKLTHRLYFLELLEEHSGGTQLKENEDIVSVFLEGTGIRNVGDHFERVGPSGGKKSWEVIWRRIGPSYGVEMGLLSQDGQSMSGEFFD
jgi:hypothetical protein